MRDLALGCFGAFACVSLIEKRRFEAGLPGNPCFLAGRRVGMFVLEPPSERVGALG